MVEADYVLCLDSDGQCDPKDFAKFWQNRDRTDIVIGWRVHRADSLLRRTFSRFFYLLYQVVFRTPVHDPSCPFVLFPREVAHRLGADLPIVVANAFDYLPDWWYSPPFIREHPHFLLLCSAQSRLNWTCFRLAKSGWHLSLLATAGHDVLYRVDPPQ